MAAKLETGGCGVQRVVTGHSNAGAQREHGGLWRSTLRLSYHLPSGRLEPGFLTALTFD